VGALRKLDVLPWLITPYFLRIVLVQYHVKGKLPGSKGPIASEVVLEGYPGHLKHITVRSNQYRMRGRIVTKLLLP